jgi:hypothetical protein
MEAFKLEMHKAGYVDLYDVLYYSLRLLTEYISLADCLTARFSSILVDEFQDTTILQNAILETFLNSGRTSLFLVGDPDQSIFSFAGAAPQTFREHLSSSDFYCNFCDRSEHSISVNRRSSQRILDFLKNLSTVPGGQTTIADWKSYPEPVRILTPSQVFSDTTERQQFWRDALCYFFDLVEENSINRDNEESFGVLAYENKIVAILQAIYQQENPSSLTKVDDLKVANRRLYRILYDLLIAIKHKEAGEWAMAYEATDRALTSLIFYNGNPRFCSYDDPEVGLNRRVWPVVVWSIMDELGVNTRQSLLDWFKELKKSISRVVRQAGGKQILQSKLGILDCRGKARDISRSIKVADELHAVIRPNLVGDNFRTIHKAKGIQRDAVLVLAKDKSELESWLFSPDTSQDESSRRGYVAFSRARKILCICCEELTVEQKEQLEHGNSVIVPIGKYQLTLF